MKIQLLLPLSTALLSLNASQAFIVSPPQSQSSSSSRTRIRTSVVPPQIIHDRHNIKHINTNTAIYTTDPTGEGEDYHPSDPAETTPQLLAALWHQIAKGIKDLTKGETYTILYPKLDSIYQSSGEPSTYLERLMAHFDVCKDVTDDFGITTGIMPYTDTKMGRQVVAGFTVKKYGGGDNKLGTLRSDGNFEFAPDPYFDNDDWDSIEEQIRKSAAEDEAFDDVNDDDSDGGKSGAAALPDIVNKVPANDEEIMDVSKKWVNKIMSDMGICPFTKGSEMAGLPMGQVFYTIDRTANVEEMYARYWKEVVRVEQTNEKELSTTLLIGPSFLIDNVELFENFSNTLTQPLEGLQVEDLLQLVFFHPEWTFRDGGERSGQGSAANYARRSPWPMINILRTSQVRTAQRGIPTGLVYQQNEKTLNRLGSKSLEKMLRLRDWSDIADLKVDRKDMEALRVAQDLQSSGGVVDEKDMSFVHDNTPAASRIANKEAEGGNVVKVVLQALEKRIKGGEGGDVAQLSGAETSAAMMASDFLLDYLNDEEQMKQAAVKGKIKKKHQANPYFDMDDDFSQNMVTEEDEGNVLFGGGGIKDSLDEDSPYSTNSDPRTFY